MIGRAVVGFLFLLVAVPSVAATSSSSGPEEDNPCQDQRLVPFVTCHWCWDVLRPYEMHPRFYCVRTEAHE